jgi:hypothetical protein
VSLLVGLTSLNVSALYKWSVPTSCGITSSQVQAAGKRLPRALMPPAFINNMRRATILQFMFILKRKGNGSL